MRTEDNGLLEISQQCTYLSPHCSTDVPLLKLIVSNCTVDYDFILSLSLSLFHITLSPSVAPCWSQTGRVTGSWNATCCWPCLQSHIEWHLAKSLWSVPITKAPEGMWPVWVCLPILPVGCLTLGPATFAHLPVHHCTHSLSCSAFLCNYRTVQTLLLNFLSGHIMSYFCFYSCESLLSHVTIFYFI